MAKYIVSCKKLNGGEEQLMAFQAGNRKAAIMKLEAKLPENVELFKVGSKLGLRPALGHQASGVSSKWLSVKKAYNGIPLREIIDTNR